MTELIVNLLLLACGIAIGYYWKKPAPAGVIESVRVEYVDRPVPVEHTVTRVEYIDKPVIVEKPTIKVERVEVPYVVEKEKTIVERVSAAPTAIPPMLGRFARPKGNPMVIKLLSNKGREIGTYECDDNLRKPSIQVRVDGLLCDFTASHQDDSGQWFYRRVGVQREH